MTVYKSPYSDYDIFLKDNINGVSRDVGYNELVMAHIVDFLRNNFPTYNASLQSDGTIVKFYTAFPEDKNIESMLPAVLVDIKDDEYEVDSVGMLLSDSLSPLYGVRNRLILEFDVWANNKREKMIIEGLLINTLLSGILTMNLQKRGIQNIIFKTSIPRGFDQTDRVLQFHTHQIATEDVYRQIMDFEIIFDQQIVNVLEESTGIIERVLVEYKYEDLDLTINDTIELTTQNSLETYIAIS